MSFILDALRKSERERQAGQVPSLSDLAAGQRQAPPGWVFWLVGLLLGVNLAGLGYWLFLRPAASLAPSAAVPGPASSPLAGPEAPVASVAARADQPFPASPFVNPGLPGPLAAPALASGAQPVVPSPSGVPASPAPSPLPVPVQPVAPDPPVPAAAIPVPAAPPAAPAQAVVNPPVPAAAPAAKGQAATRRRPLAKVLPDEDLSPVAPPYPRVAPQPRPGPYTRADAMDDAELERETEEELLADARTLERSIPPLTVPRAGRNGIPYLRDLPLSFQERIPPLKISMFAYSRNPAERFVIIDMKKHRVGDQIPGGALLMEIQAENLLLELEGQKFLLPRF